MLYKQEELDKFWDIAKDTYKIQQIREEWEWMINKTVNSWEDKGNILEIGCYDGGSSSYLSNFAKNMVIMDWHDPSRFDPSAIINKDDVDFTYKYIGKENLNEFIRSNPPNTRTSLTYIGGDSHKPSNLESMLRSFPENELVSFAFIDGDHSYEGVKADFENVKHQLCKGAAVVFHDIAISDFHHDHGCYVGEFWRDLKEQGYKTEEFSTNPDWAGIGILWFE